MNLSAPSGLATSLEPLPCGGSGSLAGLRPPDSLSPCLQWLPAHRFTFNYLSSQTRSEEIQEHSIKTFWRFLSLKPLLLHLEWAAQSCPHHIPVLLRVQDYETVQNHILFFFLKRCIGTEVSIFQSVSAPSGWMDIMWLLKKNVGVKVVLIYDVIRNLTSLPQHYCQGAMVIRQPIHFSRSRLATLLRICLLSNCVKQTTPSVVFYVPRKFQLCRVCRWLKTSCIGANECDLGAKLCKSERSSRLFLFTRLWLRSGW